MLRPAAMLRLRAVVLERDRTAVLWTLGRLGAVELTPCPAGPDTAPLPPPDRREARARCEDLLARAAEVRRGLEVPDVPGRGETFPDLDAAETALAGIEARAAELVARRDGLARRRDDEAAALEPLAGWRAEDLPPAGFLDSEFLHVATGSLPAGALETLGATLPEPVTLVPLPRGEDRQPVVVLAPHGAGPGLDQTLRDAGFRPVNLPRDATALAARQADLADAVAALAGTAAAIAALAAEAGPVLAGVDHRARTEGQLLAAEEGLPRTEAAVLVTGWVPAGEADAVREGLQAATGGRMALGLSPPAGEPEADIPVQLRPSPWLEPFARLVEAFGLPAYGEVEPTAFLAASYVLMFGMMFGDVGHGALLVLAGGVALARHRRVGSALLAAGLSSMVFGAVYGSVFGITALKPYALWRDPLEGDPLALLLVALGLGVVMNSLGVILNVVNRLRRRDYLGALLDPFGIAGVLFYWGALALVLGYGALQSRGLLPVAFVLFLALPVAAWILKGPLELLRHRRDGREPGAEGIGAAVTESAMGAFEASFAYLANTISFVRLAAYALSHAALLLATFLMAADLDRGSAAGPVWSALVIVLGNAIAIVLEGLVAAVQALRLEYYEFFGKFFAGTGRPFRPFRLAP